MVLDATKPLYHKQVGASGGVSVCVSGAGRGGAGRGGAGRALRCRSTATAAWRSLVGGVGGGGAGRAVSCRVVAAVGPQVLGPWD